MRAWLMVIAMAAGAVACKGSGGRAGAGKGPRTGKATGTGSGPGPGTGSGAGQTFAEAMTILCGRGTAPPDVADVAPTDRADVLGKWLDEQITNGQARAVLAAINTETDPRTRIVKAAGEAGITGCVPLALFAPRVASGVAIPVMAGEPGTRVLDQEALVIAVNDTRITVEGRAAVGVKDGVIADTDLARLASVVQTALATHDHDGDPVVAIDGTLPAAALTGIARALAQVPVTAIQVAVRVGADVRAVRIVLPRTPSSDPLAVEMTVELTATGVLLASRTGKEGTERSPLMTVAIDPLADAGAAVQEKLGAIVHRRWPSATRGAPEPLYVTAAAAVPVETVVQLVAWIQALPDGTPLFPDVAFGASLM